jgi:hypothetical protein
VVAVLHARRVEQTWWRSAGTATRRWAQFGAQFCFSNYSNFAQISKYKTKIILMSKSIETWHGARIDHSK